MRDVLITENITGEAMDELLASTDSIFDPNLWQHSDKLIEMIPQFKALIVRNQTKVSRELIQAGNGLQIIGRAGVGLDNVDLGAATEQGIVVAFTPEQNTNSVAELAIGMMLSLARKIPEADRDTRTGGWKRQRFTGIEIQGKTLGLVGFGRIGASTAAKARALGMDIVAYDPFVDSESSRALDLRAEMMSLDELLSRSDFISCHLPETAETINLFNYEKFCLMKPSAFFINTSRGGVVDENGLIKAIEDRRLAGAALDVRQKEPPVIGRLEELDNVILLPHIGAFTEEGQCRVVSAVCRDVAAVLKGDAARNYANFGKPARGEKITKQTK